MHKELKGINMDRPEGGEIKLTLVDYLPRYREAEEERKRFEERVAAPGAQLRWGLRIWPWASAAWIWVVVEVQLDLISKSIDPFSRAIRAARVIGAVTIASRLNPVVATDQPLSESHRSGFGASIVPDENPLAYQTPAQIFARAARRLLPAGQW